MTNRQVESPSSVPPDRGDRRRRVTAEQAPTPDLAAHHWRQLHEESGIGEAEILARGYRTVGDPKELLDIGFANYQTSTPGLLVPGWKVTGNTGPPQYRPDRPRVKANGKSVKYETIEGSSLYLDVPPAIRSRIGDPSHPIAVTEGAKKADSAVSHGLDCLSIAGVYGWRGRNSNGGLTALADWEPVGLNGRLVYLAFDSDAMTKKEVHGALKRLTAFLRLRGAQVRIVYFPEEAQT